MKNKSIFKIITLSATIISSSLYGVSAIHAESPKASVSVVQEATKYPANLMSVLRTHLGVPVDSTVADEQINLMPKVNVMDIYFASQGKPTNGQLIRNDVGEIFNFSLDMMSDNGEGSFLFSYAAEIMEGNRISLQLSPTDTSLDATIMAMPKNEVMDRFLSSYGTQIEGSVARRVINEIFGVNLDGISGLERAHLSVYSKGQWELDSPTDLLIISSSKGDIDLYVGVTDYYIQKQGTNQLPTSLQQFLVGLGFVYNTVTNQYDYHNPAGESVSDALKVQVIGQLVATINSIL